MTNDPSQGFEPYVNGGAQSVYRAWYPDGGGNLTVRAGANLIGDVMLASPASYGRPVTSSIGYNSDTPGNWLWRQGSGSAAIGQAQPTAWWINFGTYVAGDINQPTDELRGFTGFGTLGGGNLSMDVAAMPAGSNPAWSATACARSIRAARPWCWRWAAPAACRPTAVWR